MRTRKSEGNANEELWRLSDMKLKSLSTVIVALALLLPARIFAQVGSTTDILMGRVSGLDSQAVGGARAEATSAETGITRTKTTGPDGRYTIVFPDGGGTYRLTVRAIGMAPVSRDIIKTPGRRHEEEGGRSERGGPGS